MAEYYIGDYIYSVTDENYYSLQPRRSYFKDRIKSYDLMLHQSIDKIFSEHCLNDSEQIKEFLRVLQHDTDQKSIIKPILEQEPFLIRSFSKGELGKLSLQWIAVLCCYEKSAELLVRSGADVNELFGRHHPQVIDEKWTIIHVLLEMEPSPENERLVRLVIEHGADLQARDCKGRTVLHFVVKGDRVQMTEMLLEKGLDVNVADDDGVTPLLVAASNRKANELVPLLMKHGADVFAKSGDGTNALARLACSPEDHTVNLARVLIEKGVSLENGENFSQHTPLHKAVENGNDEMVNLYLDHGANVNAQNQLGESPLYLAAKFDKRTTAEILLKRGANINLRTIGRLGGRTALHAACLKATMISSRMFRIDNFDKEGFVIASITAIIELLLSAGADLLAEDCDGYTPFAVILSEGRVDQPATWLMIRVLAMKSTCQPSIELKDERIIERYRKLLDRYRKCTDEVDRMKSTKFVETCTFFELLTKSRCQIAALMRNPNFETKFKHYFVNHGLRFPIYVADILRAFERAQNHYLVMLEQNRVINEAVYNILPDLVVDKVVHYILNCCENVIE